MKKLKRKGVSIMSVHLDKNKTYYVQYYYVVDGKRIHTKKRGFKTKREAKEFDELCKKKTRIIGVTLEKFVNYYFEDKKHELKERSINTKKNMIYKHILPYFGSKKMDKITSLDILEWQNMMMEKGYEDTYLRSIRNQLNALFTHATKYYDLNKNPCTIVPKMGKVDADKVNFWTLEEYREFISKLDQTKNHYIIFQVLFWTGMRVGELLALTKKDIDLNKNQINIDKTYYRDGKNDIISAPKTSSSIRVVDIPQFLADELKAHMNRIYDLKDDQRLFPIGHEAVQHKLQRTIKEYNLKYIHVHCLRHSCAAYLISQNVPAIVIKERLGHKDIQITLNT